MITKEKVGSNNSDVTQTEVWHFDFKPEDIKEERNKIYKEEKRVSTESIKNIAESIIKRKFMEDNSSEEDGILDDDNVFVALFDFVYWSDAIEGYAMIVVMN
jgi:hypothetical protein